MPYNKTITADSVIKALVENKSLYNLCNRSYDGLVREGASSVDIPALPTMVVKSTGTSSTHADRKKVKANTSMVNVPLEKAVVPIAEEVVANFETNGSLAREFANGARDAFTQFFNAAVISTAQQTNIIESLQGEKLGWKDITNISAIFNTNKVPDAGRLIVVPAALQNDFYDIDVVKQAVGYNKDFLEGRFLRILDMNFFLSGLVEKVEEKDNLVGIYGPGLAFILSRYMEQKEVYDPEEIQTNIDFISHYGTKLLKNEFGIVILNEAAPVVEPED